MKKKIKSVEIGSEFSWDGLPAGNFCSWPSPRLFLALGRDAVLILWNIKKERNSDRLLFVPDYFCPEISKFWQNNGIAIRRYKDDPRWEHPDWTTLTPDKGDFVLAVNYFGTREGFPWSDWHRKNSHVILIEDHSHDPFSVWAKNSKADYCFASIRKIFPVPDGAILWAPQHQQLPLESKNQNWSASALKLAGMIWKKEYLNNKEKDISIKDIYRTFQIEGEKLFSSSCNLCISPWSRNLLLNGFPKSWRIRREKNVRLILKLLNNSADYKPLFSTWPSGSCPFNAILEFKTSKMREIFRSRIISKGIFTPVHWDLSSDTNKHSLDLSRRILTIPVDHRYSIAHMRFIAAIIKKIVF
jgi:hypothetical protein